MLKTSLTLAALLGMGLAGCQMDSADSARLSTQARTVPELAAYAASHPYPATMPASEQVHVAAIVNRADSTIKIYNFGNRPIHDARVWVNKSYVQHINGVASNSSAIVRMSELYNGLGQTFTGLNSPVSLVQVETDDGLYTLLGPASE
jgi:hypothetical protein